MLTLIQNNIVTTFAQFVIMWALQDSTGTCTK